MNTVLDIEITRLEEQVRLDTRKSAAERNRWGQFATPPALALDIARYARKHCRKRAIRFLEPAAGTGAFFSAFRQTFPEKTISAAIGVERDPDLACAARALWGEQGLDVTTADFTRLEPPEEPYDLILTNPPYVRHHHLTPDDKSFLQRRTARRCGLKPSGLAGLYVYFLLLSHDWLAERGLAIWLIPSEFMDVNYGEAARDYLTHQVTLLHIHRFCPDDVQFTDALVSSAIVVLRKAPPPTGHKVRFSLGGSLNDPALEQDVCIGELKSAQRWTQFPRRSKKRANVPTVSLGEFFAIKRGLATGANDFFILERSKAKELGISPRFLKPILPSPRYLRQCTIESDHDGYPLLAPQLVMIDCEIPEAQLKDSHPGLWAYLQQGKARGIHEGYLASRRSPWYSQENRPPAPYLCTYMGRSANGRKPFRFIWNKSRAVAANVYLMLYPKRALAERLAADAALYQRVFEALEVVPAETFMKESRGYGGGLFKLEPSELARVPADRLSEILGAVAFPAEPMLFA